MERYDIALVEVVIAVATLLGGYFGIPKLVEAFYLKREKNRIIRQLQRLEYELKDSTERGASRSETFNKLKDSLWSAKEVFAKNKEFLQEQLDRIISDLYKAKEYDKIQEIRHKFEKHYEFSVTSWANIAIANMNLYHLDGVNEYREFCLEACSEAIKRLPNYGTPRAVILLVHMIDHDRGKKIDQQQMAVIINEINSGKDKLVSRETYDYLDRCSVLGDWGIYVDSLFEIFPKEMETMKQRFLGA